MAVLIAALASGNALANPILTFEPDKGLFKVVHHSVPIVQAQPVFWHGDWKWIGVRVNTEQDDEGYILRPSDRDAALSMSGSAARLSSRAMRWRIRLVPGSHMDGAVYGGFVFKFNVQAFSRGGFKPEPRLLPGRRGWQIKLEPGQKPLVVRFKPAPKSLFFERGRKNEIRAYFLKKGEPSGLREVVMSVELPDGGRIEPPLAARVAQPSGDDWYADLLGKDDFPVDLSFLNDGERPSGRHGFLQARGEDLVFEDGTPARFWGTNITAYALFRSSKPDIKQQARRLARLGYNLVRFHHHDSHWARLNVFGERTKKDPLGNSADLPLRLDEQAMDTLDWWIKCLKDEGIYVWLDLHGGRTFTGREDIEHFNEIAGDEPRAQIKGFNYVNQDIQQRLKTFNEAYLNRVNSYTDLAYRNDPAIVGVLITNENDLTHHFGNQLLPDKNVPAHNAIYMREARAFARKHGLSEDETWRSWKHGPSKLFLADLEHRFNMEMISHLHELGLDVPIATTSSWGEMPLSGLLPLTDGGLIDAHAYGKPNPFESNPLYMPSLIHWMAAAQVAGKPLSVTEWNVSPFPAPGRGNVPPYVAAIARLQGWDAPMHYAYTQRPVQRSGRAGNWEAVSDPAMLAMMPAAALLFRRGDVSEARKTYNLDFGRRILDHPISPETSAAIRTLAEQSRIRIRMPDVPELPWLKRAKLDDDQRGETITVNDPERRFLDREERSVTSDTGEISRSWETGVFKIDTPRSKIASGWIGGREIELGEVSIEARTANATIAVQSLDGRPIGSSGSVLISLAAQAVPQGSHDYLAQPVEAKIRVPAPDGLSLYALEPNGSRSARSVAYRDGRYIIGGQKPLDTWWYVLEGREVAD
ncbi:MAG: glycosyl hydrolase family 5 [Gammaproteobacteria bacterium]|nr:glycosyl hydrolase family 5 [Gammaproteobacteria bacterium]